MRRPKRGSPESSSSSDSSAGPVAPLRIIGGEYRGRALNYSGDVRTRPMKQRVREATFNLLGPDPKGKCVIDLFAGTGALAIEAISRGAAEAIMIEKHFPTAKLIEDTIRQLQIKAPCQVLGGDAFYWGSRLEITSTLPWLLFCSPPYALYQSHQQEMLALLTCLLEKAPTESVVVVEADQEFDPQLLPAAEDWRVRDYPPARICLLRKE